MPNWDQVCKRRVREMSVKDKGGGNRRQRALRPCCGVDSLERRVGRRKEDWWWWSFRGQGGPEEVLGLMGVSLSEAACCRSPEMSRKGLTPGPLRAQALAGSGLGEAQPPTVDPELWPLEARSSVPLQMRGLSLVAPGSPHNMVLTSGTYEILALLMSGIVQLFWNAQCLAWASDQAGVQSLLI